MFASCDSTNLWKSKCHRISAVFVISIVEAQTFISDAGALRICDPEITVQSSCHPCTTFQQLGLCMLIVELQDQWNGPYFFFLKIHISAPGTWCSCHWDSVFGVFGHEIVHLG